MRNASVYENISGGMQLFMREKIAGGMGQFMRTLLEECISS